MVANVKDNKQKLLLLGRLAEVEPGGDIVGEYSPKFPLGDIALTMPVKDALIRIKGHPGHFISQHAEGFWGDVTKENAEANDLSVKNGHGMIFSLYMLKSIGRYLCIKTELERDRTLMLMQEEV